MPGMRKRQETGQEYEGLFNKQLTNPGFPGYDVTVSTNQVNFQGAA